jgi:sulfite reductase alpha subunit
MADNLPKTPLLDELETGKWPSFVREIKLAAQKSPMARDLLGQLEQSYREKIGTGSTAASSGHGLRRRRDRSLFGPSGYLAERIALPHLRINQPAGWFYTSDALRKLCDIWERHGSGVTNMHGSTGDIVFLGTRTEELEPIFDELQKANFDIGGSGSDMRTPSCCCGMARCEWACYDTMAACHDFTMSYQDELHRPAFPYKFKFKFSGCPNDCVASIARSDMSIIGTWRDDIQVNQAEVKKYADGGVDIFNDVILNCPGKCMKWDGQKLDIDNSSCRHCMHCINVMPKALAPGKDRGATVLIGAKAPIVEGALLSSVLIPFVKMEPPYQEIKDVVEAIWDVWCEEGKNRERIGEFIQRVGLGNFLEVIGVAPVAEMVAHPRENPYVFYEEYFEADEAGEEN